MKKQVLKIVTVVVLVMVLTMTNFIFVGSSLISYAADNIATNQSNVKFDTYFKDSSGNKLKTKEINFEQVEDYLYLQVEVNKEGYLDGEITLAEGANFKLVSSESEYVESIEENKINLYSITAGTSIEIPVKIEPIKEENFNLGLLDMESEITINGIYKDSSEREKKVNSTRTVNLKFTEELSQENIVNEVKTITNKIVKIDGEEKRVVQLEWNIGLKDKNYPVKEIIAKMQTPTINDAVPEIEEKINLNTMTSYDYKNENNITEITLKNEQTSEGTITWKKTGTENIILTYIYNKDIEVKDITINPEIKMTLYNGKELTATTKTTINQENQDRIIDVTTKNQENEIYKGKLEAGLDRNYITRTSVRVNLAKAVENINIQENASTYTANGIENAANIFYSKTMIKKEQFDKILGENGKITITNLSGEILGIIDATTAQNDDGYLSVDYSGKEAKDIKVTLTAPITEGTLEINHIKTAKQTDKSIIQAASRIYNTVLYSYNQETEKQIENSINLKDATTQSKLTINKDQLSTVVENEIEMRVTLLANDEKYSLFENPEILIELPEQVENIEITKIEKIYDDNQEFSEPTYNINGKTINILLQGKQTQYKSSSVEGITIVVNAKIGVNKKAATSDEQIKMTYTNQETTNELTVPIKITAPKEITTVNNIKELSVETIGQEDKTTVNMQKGIEARDLEAQIEIINSNPVAINEVKILGDFPTNDSENNMGIKITEGLKIDGANDTKVYYSENENATDDLNNSQNGWTENISDGSSVKKYLITAPSLETASSMQASYKMQVPENLEYNLNAEEGYKVTAVNSENGTTSSLEATKIAMETGVGPQIETKLDATVGGNKLEQDETVKNGEVIKYKIEVTNTGSENITGVSVTGGVPEGTTLVEPMDNYEYTGAAYYKETDKTSYENTIETLEVGKTAVLEYEVRLNSDVPEGTILENKTRSKIWRSFKRKYNN